MRWSVRDLSERGQNVSAARRRYGGRREGRRKVRQGWRPPIDRLGWLAGLKTLKGGA